MLPKSLAGLLVFISFLLGIFAASYIPFSPFAVFLAGAVGASGIILGVIRQRQVLLSGFICLALAAGLWRMGAALQPNLAVESIIASERTFQALVLESPDVRGSVSRLLVKTSELTGADVRFLVVTRRFPEYERGETILIKGKIESLETEQFPVNLKRQGIEAAVRFPEIEKVAPQPFSWLFYLNRAMQAFREALREALPEPDAGYVLGLLIGERSAISDDLREAFNRTGTSHIVALSGFNITLITIFFGGILGSLHFSPKARLAAISVFIFLFVLLVEGGASVIRAAVMGVLGLIARERGRIYEMTNALVFAAAVMIFINPYLLRFDLSFQLSFLATLGIIIVPLYIRRYFGWLPETLDIRETVMATVAAEIFVFPLILWHFGSVSLIAPLANLLVLPFIAYTMFGGFVVGVIGLAASPIAGIFGWVLHLMISYELFSIRTLASWSGSSAAFPRILTWVFALPAAILTGIYFYRRFRSALIVER